LIENVVMNEVCRKQTEQNVLLERGCYKFVGMMLQTSKLKRTIIGFIHDYSCLIFTYAVYILG